MITEAVITNLVKSIERAELVEEPFHILYMEDCFPHNFYKLMTSKMLAFKNYRGINRKDMLRKDGTSARSVVELNENNLLLLELEEQKVWSCVKEALFSDKIKETFFRKLKMPLSIRFGINETEVEKIQAYPRCALNRDVEGFQINPHTDVLSKIVTVMFYLPVDLSQLNLGTTFYKASENSLLSLLLDNFNFVKAFVPNKTFEFRPNSGYAFVVTKGSWHGRDELSTNSGIRNTLALTYFEEKNFSRTSLNYI